MAKRTPTLSSSAPTQFIRVISAHSTIARSLADRLRQPGGYQVQRLNRPTETYELRLRSGVLPGDMQDLLNRIQPFQPPIIPDAELPGGVDAELHLGDSRPFGHWNLHIHSDSPTLTDTLRNGLSALDFNIDSLEEHYGPQENNQMQYGGASPLARHIIQWLLQPHGLSLTENKEWEDSDQDIFIRAKDPSATPLAQRFRVLIRSDDLAAAHELSQQLREDGFSDIAIEALPPRAAIQAKLRVKPGPLANTPAATRLQVRAQQIIARRGVDPIRYPLDVDDDGESACRQAQLVLPLTACAERRRPPYDGPDRERFEIAIRTDQDQHPAVQELAASLRAMGFKSVEIRSTAASEAHRLPTVAELIAAEEEKDEIDWALGAPDLPEDEAIDPGTTAADDDEMEAEIDQIIADLDDDDDTALVGFRVVWNAAQSQPEVAAQIRPALHRAMTDLGALPRYTLSEEEGDEDRAAVKIRIDCPVTGIADGSRPTALPYRLQIHTRHPDRVETLLEEFRTWGLTRCESQRERHIGEPNIQYGGAPAELIERIRAKVQEHTGFEPELTRCWPPNDHDIWVYLPDSPDRPPSRRRNVATPQPIAWFREPVGPAPRPLVNITASAVRIGEITLPRRSGPHHALAPSPAAFVHYCLDPITAETLAHIAASVALGEPCLLEGETSTSKTSAILYLAALLNQPVIRINLNGQTDTGELVGRYVPRALETDLPVSPEELREVEELLEPETRLILNRAAQEQRALGRAEVQQVMANERMRSHPWRWQDGPVVEALRQGWWIILDELNLAEPQIVERLNSVLEREPTLVLTEHDYRVYGNGGEPIHADFRVFATMNPAEYAGRSTLSPAYRNRWQAFRQAPKPGEREYLAMARFLASGAQPETVVLGQRYRAEQGQPSHPALNTPEFAPRLSALTRFHVALEHATGQGDGPARLGARRRERYVFTRRDLLSVLDYLARAPAVGQTDPDQALRTAIHRYYLSRVTAGEDQQTVLQLLAAAGFAPAL
jgi:MoxR-like ATPase